MFVFGLEMLLENGMPEDRLIGQIVRSIENGVAQGADSEAMQAAVEIVCDFVFDEIKRKRRSRLYELWTAVERMYAQCRAEGRADKISGQLNVLNGLVAHVVLRTEHIPGWN